MRSAGEQLQPNDLKATINSILSATDLNKLSPEDKKDITKKIAGNVPTANDNMTEIMEPTGYDDGYGDMDNMDMVDNEPTKLRASGGQTIGEKAINERLLTIIERAKNNVRKNNKNI